MAVVVAIAVGQSTKIVEAFNSRTVGKSRTLSSRRVLGSRKMVSSS